jgi:hypothetical protein
MNLKIWSTPANAATTERIISRWMNSDWFCLAGMTGNFMERSQMPARKIPLLSRLIAGTRRNGGCLEWIKAKDSDGYGLIKGNYILKSLEM